MTWLSGKEENKPRSLHQLVEMLKTGDITEQWTVFYALAQRGTDAIVPTIIALTNEGSEVRRLAIAAFGYVEPRKPDVHAVKTLTDAALSDRDENVQAYAVTVLSYCLWLMDDADIVPTLLTIAATDASIRIRNLALHTLAVTETEDERVATLFEAALEDDTVEPMTKAMLLFALQQQQRKKGVPDALLITLAGDRPTDTPTQFLSGTAFRILGEQKSPATFDALLGWLTDTVWQTRSSAASALGAFGDARAIEPLVATLSDTESKVRSSAASALGKLGDARAVEPLLSALADPDTQVRTSAVRALDKMGDARALPLLFDIQKTDTAQLGNGQYTIREAATEAIAAITRRTQPADPAQLDARIAKTVARLHTQRRHHP